MTSKEKSILFLVQGDIQMEQLFVLLTTEWNVDTDDYKM